MPGAAWDPRKDPCANLLELYTDCVKAQEKGLREGDECLKEASAYKACRKSHRSPEAAAAAAKRKLGEEDLAK